MKLFLKSFVVLIMLSSSSGHTQMNNLELDYHLINTEYTEGDSLFTVAFFIDAASLNNPYSLRVECSRVDGQGNVLESYSPKTLLFSRLTPITGDKYKIGYGNLQASESYKMRVVVLNASEMEIASLERKFKTQ